MAKDNTPETFVVGEMVELYQGESRSQVQVVAVNGDEAIVDVHGKEETFRARPSDGKHVALGHEDYAVMPDMIFHSDAEPVKNSRWNDMMDFLKIMLKSP